MIAFSAIFANCQRKKLAFLSKTNVMINFFKYVGNSSSLSKKRQYFANNFGKNNSKIITSVPDLSVTPGKSEMVN
jgi:hypothetical protein